MKHDDEHKHDIEHELEHQDEYDLKRSLKAATIFVLQVFKTFYLIYPDV